MCMDGPDRDCEHRHNQPADEAPGTPGNAEEAATRRSILFAGLGLLLAGCEPATRVARLLPDPTWKPGSWREIGEQSSSVESAASSSYTPATTSRTPAHHSISHVISRSNWCHGDPVPGLMDRMKPIKYITVHHDGMDAFRGTSERASANRLESIRRAHRSYNWGDIGYHFAIDRAGRVWQARPIRWQGAHVKYHNEGNIGVLCLGNFERQHPSDAQLAQLQQFLRQLMREYHVTVPRLRTHQEWAATLCPGRNLQVRVEGMRQNGALA